MAVYELRDLEAARRYLTGGLWLQRVLAPMASGVRPGLEWTLEVASGGQPLPPIGFVADIGHVLLGTPPETRGQPQPPNLPGLPAGLMRSYEDLVLGKVFADWTLERSADAVRRFQGRDRARGVAFVVNQIRDRTGFGGVLLSPAVIKGLLEAPPDEVMSRGWDALSHNVEPLLVELYQELIAAVRRVAELLGPEDVFELEHQTALAELGQRVALRQLLQTAGRLEAGLPKYKPRPAASPREVPTRVLDEDTYPVGGFASISTRGTIESLLHSQLAFMESATVPRPDLFDIKFVRDELLYYSRDENQFLRKRRSFVMVLMPDLARARFKDPELPTQRIVLTLAVLVTAVRKTTDWLSADALSFEIVFVGEGDGQPLSQEEKLLATVLREAIANGTVRMTRVTDSSAAGRVVNELTRRSLCEALFVSTNPPVTRDPVESRLLLVNGPRPHLLGPGDDSAPDLTELWESWQDVVNRLTNRWVN
jgi:hypothetical protein